MTAERVEILSRDRQTDRQTLKGRSYIAERLLERARGERRREMLHNNTRKLLLSSPSFTNASTAGVRREAAIGMAILSPLRFL